MINVELSNIWNCISLPDLLGSEKEIFDAHLRLRSNQPDSESFLGWLGQPDSVMVKTIHSIRRAAETIRESSDVLVVLGSGPAWLGARAGIEMLQGRSRILHSEKPAVLFSGNHFSSSDWLQLCEFLSGKDYSVHIIDPCGTETETAVASRSIRWMMERHYGADAKKRIYVSSMADSPIALMAREEGYTLLSLPQEPGGAASALTSAALLPMAAAGIDPLDVMEGAANAYSEMDIRAFENPAWMYAGARYALTVRGRTAELLGTFAPSMEAFGKWWQALVFSRGCQDGDGLLPVPLSFSSDLDFCDAALSSGRCSVFETLLRTKSAGIQNVNVEMDWKDYDGLGYLSGKTFSDMEQAFFEAQVQSHGENGTPVICLESDGMDAGHFGELVYFLELSTAIYAAAMGMDLPDGKDALPTRRAAEAALKTPGI